MQRVVVLIALCAGFDVLMSRPLEGRCDLRLFYCISMVDSICLMLTFSPCIDNLSRRSRD